MTLRTLLFIALSLIALRAQGVEPINTVTIDQASTSIYIGKVHLDVTPLRREGIRYTGRYDARVFPLFFYNEAGQFWIEFTPEQQQALERGERVNFTGRATSTKREEHTIDGFATPTGPGKHEGRIKVKIYVSKKIVLIFNTRYSY